MVRWDVVPDTPEVLWVVRPLPLALVVGARRVVSWVKAALVAAIIVPGAVVQQSLNLSCLPSIDKVSVKAMALAIQVNFEFGWLL